MDCSLEPKFFIDVENNSFLQTIRYIHFVYQPLHAYICLVICTFGIVTNVLNVIILTRPRMRTSINVVLTGIAFCDIGTMLSYLIYVGLFSLHQTRSYYSMCFIMIHMFLSVVLHSSSLWLAVAVAFIRRLILDQAAVYSRWMSTRRAWMVVMYSMLIISILTIPSLFTYSIQYYDVDPRTNSSIYTVDASRFATANECALFKAVLWLHGIAFKVIPCTLLAVLISCLVITLRAAQKRRHTLLGSKRANVGSDRTTVLLLSIVSISLLTEIPQGLVIIFSGISLDVTHNLYPYVADILDLLSLINSSINFFLYCIMSSRYRQTFWAVLLPKRLYMRVCNDDYNTEGITRLQVNILRNAGCTNAGNGCANFNTNKETLVLKEPVDDLLPHDSDEYL